MSNPNYEALCKPWIDQIRDASAHIVTLSLDELRRLPSKIRSDAGIYFFWLDDQLQYIGKSRALKKRMRDHRRDTRIPRDRFTLLELSPDYEVLRDHERA